MPSRVDGTWSVGVIGLLLLFLGLLPVFLGRFHVVLVTEIIIWGIYALSFDLIFGYTGMLSFCQSIFFGAGAYVAGYSLGNGIGIAGALLLGLTFAGIMGLVVGGFVVRVRGSRFFLVTLVLSILFYLVALDLRWLTGGDDGMIVQIGFPGLTQNFYLVAGVGIVVGFFVWVLVNSSVGLVFRMIRDNERRARLLGYSVWKYRIGAFSAAGAIAGLAGGLYAYTSGFVSAGLFHWTRSADAVVWTVLGGSGSVVGPFVGAAVLTFIREGFSSLMGRIYPVIVGGLLIYAVVASPTGIVGKFAGLFEYLQGFRDE